MRRKVIGLGAGKTGTKTLQAALALLGYTNCSWSFDLIEAWARGDVAAVLSAVDAHDCVEDWPFAALYAECMDRYGRNARYVLTVRETPEVWLESAIAHADRSGPKYDPLRRLIFGYDHPRGNEERHLAFYRRHNAAVHAAVVGRGLQDCFLEACWEHGDGWEELCSLIGESVPVGLSFPHENRRPD